MKIFNRGTPETKAAPAAPATPSAPAGPAAASAATVVPAPAPAPVATPAAPPAPDIAVILDANVKEMSEKIARLATSLESSEQERNGFEAKIEQMEERMRKLSSLTEMISAQYNPFVGEAPMSERAEMPRPEVGLAPPADASLTLPPPPVAAPALSVQLDEPPAAEPAFALPPIEEAPPAATQELLSTPEIAPAAEPEAPAEPGVYLWSIPAGFETSLLLLGWSDMLLKSAGSRECLLDLVNYYHNIGWIGDPARDQLLAYADGLAAPAGRAVPDWRADVEVHEKSLLFVEKLRAVSQRRQA